jgi:ferredoxin like protein
MTIKRLGPEELLSLDKFSVDEGNPHILVDKAICATCKPKACLIVCPAR